MTGPPLILSIDQGTTSSRAIVFDQAGKALAVSQYEFTQFYPDSGWVEHDPEEIWETTVKACQEVIRQSASTGKIIAIGITNQRETTIVWDRNTGKPIYNAIVWQDRRTADFCARLKTNQCEESVKNKTGLLLDPYFSATKIAWILNNVGGARQKAIAGNLVFGTVDTFLIWRLTRGRVHATDATNASRTLLYNIHRDEWDSELLSLFDIPEAMLPEVKDCVADYGIAEQSVLGIQSPILGVAGDQQAALVGQAGFAPGMVKSTYGTGCFMILNTGSKAIESQHNLLTTIGYRLDAKPVYALEGSIFNAGTTIQWLRDGMGLLENTHEVENRIHSLQSNDGVYLVPAFTGLGAPHWDPEARGLISGLTRDTSPAHFVRAAVESVCYQTRDLIEAMLKDGKLTLTDLRVDGGMSVNNWMLQFLADILQVNVTRPVVTETTALGAFYLAGIGAGIYHSVEAVGDQWRQDRQFIPNMSEPERQRLLCGWQAALKRCLSG